MLAFLAWHFIIIIGRLNAVIAITNQSSMTSMITSNVIDKAVSTTSKQLFILDGLKMNSEIIHENTTKTIRHLRVDDVFLLNLLKLQMRGKRQEEEQPDEDLPTKEEEQPDEDLPKSTKKRRTGSPRSRRTGSPRSRRTGSRKRNTNHGTGPTKMKKSRKPKSARITQIDEDNTTDIMNSTDEQSSDKSIQPEEWSTPENGEDDDQTPEDDDPNDEEDPFPESNISQNAPKVTESKPTIEASQQGDGVASGTTDKHDKLRIDFFTKHRILFSVIAVTVVVSMILFAFMSYEIRKKYKKRQQKKLDEKNKPVPDLQKINEAKIEQMNQNLENMQFKKQILADLGKNIKANPSELKTPTRIIESSRNLNVTSLKDPSELKTSTRNIGSSRNLK